MWVQSKNFLKLSRMGAVIVDADPNFYNKAKTIDDQVDFLVGKILEQLNIKHPLQPR